MRPCGLRARAASHVLRARTRGGGAQSSWQAPPPPPRARARARAPCPFCPTPSASRPPSRCPLAGGNVSAVYSLGAGIGQPWTPAASVAVAPYGQMVFFTAAAGANPALVSLNAAGGTTNFRLDMCATYFAQPTPCGGAPPGTTVPAVAPVTDALRVYVGACACDVAAVSQHRLALPAAACSRQPQLAGSALPRMVGTMSAQPPRLLVPPSPSPRAQPMETPPIAWPWPRLT